MEFPTFIKWTNPFGIRVWDDLQLDTNFKSTFSKQTVQNLIRRCIMQHLIWSCTVCQCPIKLDGKAGKVPCFLVVRLKALTRILKTGVQDSHLAKSRSPTGKSGSPNLCIPYIFSILAGSDTFE